MNNYYFFFIDSQGREYRFYSLAKRTAISMYNIFKRDMAIHDYKKIGWSIDK